MAYPKDTDYRADKKSIHDIVIQRERQRQKNNEIHLKRLKEYENKKQIMKNKKLHKKIKLQN